MDSSETIPDVVFLRFSRHPGADGTAVDKGRRSGGTSRQRLQDVCSPPRGSKGVNDSWFTSLSGESRRQSFSPRLELWVSLVVRSS